MFWGREKVSPVTPSPNREVGTEMPIDRTTGGRGTAARRTAGPSRDRNTRMVAGVEIPLSRRLRGRRSKVGSSRPTATERELGSVKSRGLQTSLSRFSPASIRRQRRSTPAHHQPAPASGAARARSTTMRDSMESLGRLPIVRRRHYTRHMVHSVHEDDRGVGIVRG
jgi:hypothetical protein